MRVVHAYSMGLGNCEEALKSCDKARDFNPVCDDLDSINSSIHRRVELEKELAVTVEPAEPTD